MGVVHDLPRDGGGADVREGDDPVPPRVAVVAVQRADRGPIDETA